jgi:hypothetical protein
MQSSHRRHVHAAAAAARYNAAVTEAARQCRCSRRAFVDAIVAPAPQRGTAAAVPALTSTPGIVVEIHSMRNKGRYTALVTSTSQNIWIKERSKKIIPFQSNKEFAGNLKRFALQSNRTYAHINHNR